MRHPDTAPIPWRLVFRLCLACLAAAWLAAGTEAVRAADLPNIVLLMGDDHGWEETGYNGHAHLRTPNLDAMAANGLRFDHFYAAHPSCSPTRGSVLTGRHPNRYGTFAPGWSIRPEEVTIAHLLRGKGYACGHFGKWHLGPVKADSPTNPGAMGFDEWLSHDNFFELDPKLSRNGAAPELFAGESSAVIVDAAIRFIEKAGSAGKPFFVVIWFGSPHEPYSGLPQDLALYDDLPEAWRDRSVSLTSNDTGLQVRRPLRDVLRERFAEITAMDRAIGVLRHALANAGQRDDTLLWYCGDNGTPPSGLASSPFRGRKGQMFEGGIRVPGVIEWPARIRTARVTRINAVTSDMLPTLCAVAGKSLPERPLDGISLLPVIEGTLAGRPTPICFWSYATGAETRAGLEPYIAAELQAGTTPLVKLSGGLPTRNFRNYRHPVIGPGDFNGARVILDGRYKLIVTGDNLNPARELFDLQDDPGESRNLAEARPGVSLRMQRQLRDWQQSVLTSLTGADY